MCRGNRLTLVAFARCVAWAAVLARLDVTFRVNLPNAWDGAGGEAQRRARRGSRAVRLPLGLSASSADALATAGFRPKSASYPALAGGRPPGAVHRRRAPVRTHPS